MGSDVGCREASMRSLAAFMRAVSKKVALPLLSAVADDKLKMAKIEENYNGFIEEYPFDDGSQKQQAPTKQAAPQKAAVKEVVEQQIKQEPV